MMMWLRLLRHYPTYHRYPRHCCIRCCILRCAVGDFLSRVDDRAWVFYIIAMFLLLEVGILIQR